MKTDWDIASKIYHQICTQLTEGIRHCKTHRPEIVGPIKEANQLLSDSAGAVFAGEIEKTKVITQIVREMKNDEC